MTNQLPGKILKIFGRERFKPICFEGINLKADGFFVSRGKKEDGYRGRDSNEHMD